MRLTSLSTDVILMYTVTMATIFTAAFLDYNEFPLNSATNSTLFIFSTLKRIRKG